MFKKLIFSSFLFLVMLSMSAQSVMNLGLEDWETSSSGRYEEPTGWATGNSPVDIPLFPPDVNPVEKTTDAAVGTYAVKMETIELIFETASGSIWLGDFELNLANPAASALFGIPYDEATEGRPISLSGMYKYNALGGDSCDLSMTLFNSNLDVNTWRGDTVAHRQIRSTTVVTEYSPFELVLDYKSSAQIDTVQIVFASSAAGADLAGQIGAQLFVDDLTLNYVTGIKNLLMPEVAVKVFPNPARDYLYMEMDKPVPNGRMQVFSTDGRMVKELDVLDTTLRLEVMDLPQGTYHYLLLDEKDGGMSSGSFVVSE